MIFIFYCFAFFPIILLICIFVNLILVFTNCVNLFYILSSRSSVDVEKDITHTVRLQSNITSVELWIIFPVIVFFLLVWCKQKSDKKVKIIIFLMSITPLYLKNQNSSDFFNKMKTCTRSNFFASEFMNICDDFQFSVT